jgi:hypothetical protein
MAIFCITSSNPTFQKLLAESKKQPLEFEMMVSKWMTQNEVYDRYPTLQELGITAMESVKPSDAVKYYQISDEDIIEELVQENKLERKCQ